MELLERHFEMALETPDGIKKLREMILSLAMQGKLVPQDPNDQPASELLKEIEAEKKRLIKEGKMKKQEPLPPIKEEEIPYEVPKGWEWVRLGTIAIFQNGDRSSKYPNENDLQVSGVPFFGAKDMVHGTLRFDNGLRFISEAKFAELSNGKLVDKDFVFLLRGTVGKMAIFHSNSEFITGFINAQMLIVRILNEELCNFFRTYFVSNFFQLMIASKTTGSAVRQIPASVFLDFSVPIPPLAEQKRIVAKIDQLMALCDKLEAERNERNRKRLTIHTAAMNRLLSASDKAAYNTSWGFITSNFDELYSVPENVEDLKKAILQLAVMGKLVPQDPNDQPASELLKEIEAEKKKLVKEGKIKKHEPLPPIKPEEIPYKVPKGWEWVRLDDLCYGITSGSTPPQNIFHSSNGIPYLKVYNIRNQKIEFDYKPQFIDIEYHRNKLKRSILYPGDVIMNIVGPPLGKVAIIPGDYPEYNCNQAIVVFRQIKKEVNTYIYTFLLAGKFLEAIELIGTAGQDNISVTKSRNIIIPLPPLAEQKRIVAKVDQLIDLCNSLERQTKDSTEKQTAVLNAILAKV